MVSKQKDFVESVYLYHFLIKISGLPNGATSSLGSSTELVAGSIMKETDSSSSDQGYATLSTPTAPNKDDKTMATLHTSAASDV